MILRYLGFVLIGVLFAVVGAGSIALGIALDHFLEKCW